MATYVDQTRVKQVGVGSLGTAQEWNQTHAPGTQVPHSGIYYCAQCGHEAACNTSDPFPPQNHKQHPGLCGAIKWKLLVKTK